MLVMFKFKNFGPFKEEMVLDMRAIKSYKEHPYNLINENDNSSLIKVAAIYGANASGKSNFTKAYEKFSYIVDHSFQRNNKEKNDSFLSENYYPFMFDDESEDTNTEFEAVYHLNGNEYKYGFIYDEDKILYEWLYKRSLSTNRQSTILERNDKEFNLGPSVKNSCEKYVKDIDSDVLALSFLSSLKLRTSVFQDVLYCVKDFLCISFSCDKRIDALTERYFKYDFNDKEKESLLKFLSAIDVGIVDISVEKLNDKIAVFTYHRGKNGEVYPFFFDVESDGTKKAIAIYSLVKIAVSKNKGLIIDEFNNQLHPLLQKYIIDLFYENSSKGQLIYTTHDTSLLDKKYMRRDQIWFTNKNYEGESSLYSLAEFRIRNDKSFEKDYLGGVFGGIPILKDFAFKED